MQRFISAALMLTICWLFAALGATIGVQFLSIPGGVIVAMPLFGVALAMVIAGVASAVEALRTRYA